MDRQYLRYTVKVWLSGVLAAPAIITIIYWIPGSDRSLPGTAIISFYLLLVALEFMFSFFTWLMFWAVTLLIVFYVNERKLRRWLVFAAGIALTVLTFAAFSWLMFSIFFDSISLALMLINCVFIGCTAWFFYPTDLSELGDNTPKLETHEQ